MEPTNVVLKQGQAKEEINYDKLLSTAGHLGRYQWILFFAIAPFYAFGVFGYFSQIFMTEVSTNHWCRIPALENFTEMQRRNIGIPKDTDSRFGYSQCEMYDVNWTYVLETGQKPDETWSTVPCQYGWEFNKSEIPYPTISSDLGWVCGKNSYQANAQSIFFIGSMFGCFLFGWIGDRYGRIPAIVYSCLFGCIGGAASTFARNLLEFSVARFVMGMSFDTCMIMPYLLLLEYIAPQYRTLIANMSGAIFYSIFAVMMPWIALYCGHWKTISLVTSLPFAIALFTKFILPESPRWLLSQGRVDEAIDKVLVIGRINKKKIPVKMIQQFKLSVANTEKERNESWLEIFKRPSIRKIFILVCLEFMCLSIMFDGLVRTIGQLDFDFFITFSIISFTEFPSIILLACIMDYTGRRWLSIVCMAMSCILCLLTAFSSGILTVIFAFLARFCVNIAYNACLQWAPELLPTPVRGSGVAVIHICGFIASFSSPYIVYLKEFVYWLPIIVLSAISGIVIFIPFALPETAMKELPQSFEDAEELTRNQQLWTLPFLEARKEKKVNKGLVNVSFQHEP